MYNSKCEKRVEIIANLFQNCLYQYIKLQLILHILAEYEIYKTYGFQNKGHFKNKVDG